MDGMLHPPRLADALREDAARVPDSVNEFFEREWKELTQQLVGLTAALGMDRERRSDVLHDVYVLGREKAPRRLSRGELRRWLFRVTANRCRLEHRRRKSWLAAIRRIVEGVVSHGEAASPDRSADQRELADVVDGALDRLKPIEREVIVLRYYCGFDSRQIGEMLAMPEGTVRSHLAKARRHLARDLSPWSEGEAT